MKKSIVSLLVSLIFGALICMSVSAVTNDDIVRNSGDKIQIMIPTFRVEFNGVEIDSVNSEYPLIVYNDITYFPMTYNDSRFLGIETWYTLESGLEITSGMESAPVYQPYTSDIPNKSTYEAILPKFQIRVNGKRIDNTTEQYPLLLFRNVTYFPLTWRFAVEEFGWEYGFTSAKGLIINSKDPMEDELVGTYKGSYMQNAGETGLTLTVYKERGKYKAVFDFYNLPGRDNAKSGKYYMNVAYDPVTKECVFTATEWIDRPSDYILLDLCGKLDDGVITGKSPTEFKITSVEKYIEPSEILDEIVGEYTGSYYASYGEAGLTLSVFKDRGQYKAIFEFYSMPGKNNYESGSYYMNVSYSELYDTFLFESYKWIERPERYIFIDLEGTFKNGVLSGYTPIKFKVSRSK